MHTIVIFFGEGGRSPFLDWYGHLPKEAQSRCWARLELLARQGHFLRRPAADYLRDGIYELRAKYGRVQYRMLYFFHGQSAVVLSHGFAEKESMVSQVEIERAIQRKKAFEADPAGRTFGKGLFDG